MWAQSGNCWSNSWYTAGTITYRTAGDWVWAAEGWGVWARIGDETRSTWPHAWCLERLSGSGFHRNRSRSGPKESQMPPAPRGKVREGPPNQFRHHLCSVRTAATGRMQAPTPGSNPTLHCDPASPCRTLWVAHVMGPARGYSNGSRGPSAGGGGTLSPVPASGRGLQAERGSGGTVERDRGCVQTAHARYWFRCTDSRVFRDEHRQLFSK